MADTVDTADTKPPARSVRWQEFIAVISAAVGVAASVLSVYSKVEADQSAKDVSRYKRQLEEQANLRAERESRARFDQVAYDAVVKLLEASNANESVMEKRQRAAMALVLATASEGMRAALLEILQTSPTVSAAVRSDAFKTAAAIADLGHTPSDLAIPPGPPVTAAANANGAPKDLAGYRVVFFHCQQSSQSGGPTWQSATASALKEQLSKDPILANARFEIKELPEVLNASPGYSIHTNQIRFNPDEGEEASSIALKRAVEATMTATTDKLQFDRIAVKKRTPQYLSVFLCGRREST